MSLTSLGVLLFIPACFVRGSFIVIAAFFVAAFFMVPSQSPLIRWWQRSTLAKSSMFIVFLGSLRNRL